MLLFTSLILSGAAFIAALFLLIRLDHARRMSDYQCNLAINLHARQMSAILKSAPILPGIARPGLVASVTTTRHRLGTVGMAVESMLLQTVRPESVNLYLSNDIDIGLLPESLIRLQDMGLNIHFVPDVGPHTKLIYALERYSNHHVITFDDDFYAPPNSLETLLRTAEQAPHAIVGNWVRQLRIGRDGKVRKAKEGRLMTPKTQVREIDAPSRPLRMGYDFFAYGTGGILYPPGCMDARVFDIATFRALCPTEDDVWFKAMSLLRDTPVAATNLGHSPKHHSLSGSQASALRHDNYCGSVQKASSQIAAVFEHFDLVDRIAHLNRQQYP